jgi:hypothetical protein
MDRVKAKSVRLVIGPRGIGVTEPDEGTVVAIDGNRFVARGAAGKDDVNDDDGSRGGVSIISPISTSSQGRGGEYD